MKLLTSLLFALLAGAAVAQPRNVLLIIADDFGTDSHSLYNSSPGAVLAPTPNINALKTTGVQFRNAYALPTCSPTRATMLTGRHPFRHGVTTAVTANDGQLAAGEFTLPRAFAANSSLGYSLAHFGKWHLAVGTNIANDPANIAGWPHYAGCLTGTLVGGANGTGTYTAWTKTINGVTGATNGTTTYATTDVTNDALAWIGARGSNPWFAWVAYNAPHTPFHKPPNDLHTYDTTVTNWANLPINNTAANQRTHYSAAVQAMDTEIGRLLNGLSPAVRANTWIIFIGDNGTTNQIIQTPFSSGHSKDSLYEGGVRVPLLISGPGVVSPNRESTALVHAVDLYSTILEMAGINVAATQPAVKPIDSRSLMPLLLNQTEPARAAYSEESGAAITAADSGRTVRVGDYKLIRFNDNTERLHLLTSDPDEQTNLLATTLSPAAQAAYAELTAQLATYVQNANPLNQPVETQWQKVTGAEYARIYRNVQQMNAQTPVTTWTPSGPVTGGGQATPAYAGIESIRVSANWVYVKGSALPHYTMGPWYFDAARTQIFVNLPSQWDMLARIPRLPQPAATRTNTNFGPTAIWVNTAIIHNQLDAFYWNGSADIDTNAEGDEYWTRNAYLAEGPTFDPAGAHQPFTGESHNHISPFALRYELGDHMNYNPATHTYTEATTPPNHSPILGWSFDGYPIYGPFGYSSAQNPASGIRRMVSGFVARDGSFGSRNLNVTGRDVLPAWAVRNGHGNSAANDSATGPAVNTAQPLGWYLQDFEYLGDLGWTQGTHFDLDECNGRWCVTPEFPAGTYAYFVTIDANNAPAYPYIIGRQYYGVKQGGNYGAASTVGFSAVESPSVTTYQGGAAAPMSLASPSVAGNQVTLQWSSVEGGSYSIESSSDLTSWTTSQTNVAGAGDTSTTTRTVPAASGPRSFHRVRRDSIDTYDAIATP